MGCERGAMIHAAWHAMLTELGVAPEHACFDRLVAAYDEPHRAYHTQRHLDDCLALLNDFRALAHRPAEVECALWFHDAVYEPMSKGNEERSAEWAAEFLHASGAAKDVADRVRELVLATRHAAVPVDSDARLLVDVDLSILGATRERYERFEDEVRREYRWVPGPLYRRKRAEILESFVARPAIYSHGPLRERFEANARSNLEWALDRLRGGRA